MKNLSIKEFFDKNGYYIEKQVFTNNDMKPLFETLYDLSWSCASNNNINMSHNLPHPSLIKFPRDLKQLDYIMLDIFKYCYQCSKSLSLKNIDNNYIPYCEKCEKLFYSDPKLVVVVLVEHNNKLVLIK